MQKQAQATTKQKHAQSSENQTENCQNDRAASKQKQQLKQTQAKTKRNAREKPK